MKPLRPLLDLVYSRTCVLCARPLTYDEDVICRRCIDELPFTHYEFSDRHKLARILQAKAPIHKATSLLFYSKTGLSGKLIHKLKYHHHARVGPRLADFLAPRLMTDPPHIILPVPLHPRKLRLRGYNQTEGFARRLARHTGARFVPNALRKRRHTPSQTTKSPWERWQNVSQGFKLRTRSNWNGRHILLTDDVITTGATLAAIVQIIHHKFPRARISVASMAFNLPH